MSCLKSIDRILRILLLVALTFAGYQQYQFNHSIKNSLNKVESKLPKISNSKSLAREPAQRKMKSYTAYRAKREARRQAEAHQETFKELRKLRNELEKEAVEE